VVIAPEPQRAESAVRALDTRKRSRTMLSDNERWIADNYDKTVHGAKTEKPGTATLPADEERVLRCLGAALIMRWNTLPQKLQRELFDDAGSMGGLSDVAGLRGELARFLHTHKNDQDEAGAASR
jgi:hypothetical protein